MLFIIVFLGEVKSLIYFQPIIGLFFPRVFFFFLNKRFILWTFAVLKKETRLLLVQRFYVIYSTSLAFLPLLYSLGKKKNFFS